MTMTRFRSASARRLLLTASLLALATTPVSAVEPRLGVGLGSPDGGPAQAAGSRRLDLSIGRSVILDLPRDAKEVFVANPAVANAVVRSARKIFMLGVANGATSVFVMDAEGRQITSLEVNVGRDLAVLRQTLRTAIPTGRITVLPAGDSILLTGNVSSAGDAQQAVDIARAFVGQTGGDNKVGGTTSQASSGQQGGGSLTGTVINAITINGRDQVMLKVTIVEMARTALKQLGVNVGGNWNVLDAVGASVNPASNLIGIGTGFTGALGAAGANVSGQFATGGATYGGTLTALERAGVSRVLAEPTLVAISGETATFLAGGEIPIVINSCVAGSGGSTSQICTPTVTYKAYGVSLAFTPIVLNEGRISIRVSTEVSEIDRDNQDAVTRSPGFRSRKTSTAIELPSGASMVTAGLISAQSAQSISGVPGLINLPILGTLFRSRDFQRRDSELMIMVTPYIAKPMETAQVARPDDNFVDASDPQTVFLGRMNKLYGTAGPGPGKGYSGRVGFITD